LLYVICHLLECTFFKKWPQVLCRLGHLQNTCLGHLGKVYLTHSMQRWSHSDLAVWPWAWHLFRWISECLYL
jgi:hypothetical protein